MNAPVLTTADRPTVQTPSDLGAVLLNGPRALLEITSLDRCKYVLLVYGTAGGWYPVIDPLTKAPLQIQLNGSDGDPKVAQVAGALRILFDVEQPGYYVLWRTSESGSATAKLTDVGTSNGNFLVQPIEGGTITLLSGKLTGFSVGAAITDGVPQTQTVDLGPSNVKCAWTVLLTLAANTTDENAETSYANLSALIGVASNGAGGVEVTLGANVGGSGYNSFGNDVKAIPTVAVVNGRVILTLTLTGDTGVKANLQYGGNLDSIFEVSPSGTGGNAVTLATVADAGAKAGSVTVVGNAVTVHYKDGDTTVGDVEALFTGLGVAVTWGRVKVKTGGTGAQVLAAPTDTHAATAFIRGANAKPTISNVSGIVTSSRG